MVLLLLQSFFFLRYFARNIEKHTKNKLLFTSSHFPRRNAKKGETKWHGNAYFNPILVTKKKWNFLLCKTYQIKLQQEYLYFIENIL